MGFGAPRSRRLRVHRSARSRRSDAGRVRARHQRRGPRPRGRAARRILRRRRRRRRRARRPQEPEPAHRRDRSEGGQADDLLALRDAAVRDRRRHRRRRDGAPQAPLPGSATPCPSAQLPGPLDDLPDDAPDPGRERLRRDRDAVHGEVHARRRAQLPGALAPEPGPVLRARRVAPDLQAAVHGRGHGSLLPDRPLLPRRGPAPRPPAGVHADRSRDELRRRGGRAGRGREADGRAVEGRAGHRAAPALPSPQLHRGDGQVRFGQARPALRAAAHRPDRDRHPPRRRRRRPAAIRGQDTGRHRQGLAAARGARQGAVARRPRQAGGVRQGVRGARPRARPHRRRRRVGAEPDEDDDRGPASRDQRRGWSGRRRPSVPAIRRRRSW